MYKVILVDDEPMIKRTLNKLINQSSSFQVVSEAEDGKEALELMEKQRHDVLFTDIRMPVMNGLDLLKEVKERNKSMEVVMISGYDDFDYVQQALRHGSADYLLKPIEPGSLEQTLNRLLELFDKKKEGYKNQGEWLQFCRETAEILSENLWQLHSSEVEAALINFHEKLRSISPNLDFSKMMYTDLFKLLRDQINLKGEFGFSFEELTSLDSIIELEEILQLARDSFNHMQHTLRIRSNWHNRNIMQAAKEYMLNHFMNEHLSLQELSEHVGMSPSYLSRIFKEEFSISFIQYLTKLRMEESASRLQNDASCKTYEIAHSIGYSDYSHFAKVFKKYFSVSPSEYKNRCERPTNKDDRSD